VRYRRVGPAVLSGETRVNVLGSVRKTAQDRRPQGQRWYAGQGNPYRLVTRKQQCRKGTADQRRWVASTGGTAAVIRARLASRP